VLKDKARVCQRLIHSGQKRWDALEQLALG
jgi:hypothetical protein